MRLAALANFANQPTIPALSKNIALRSLEDTVKPVVTKLGEATTKLAPLGNRVKTFLSSPAVTITAIVVAIVSLALAIFFYLKNSKAQAASQKANLADNLSNTNSTLALQKELATERTKYSELEKTNAANAEQLTQAKARVVELGSELAEKNQRITQLQASLQTVSDAGRDTFNSSEELRTKFKNLEAQVQQLTQKDQASSGTITQLQGMQAHLQKSLAAANAKADALQELINKQNQREEASNRALAANGAATTELQRQIAQLKQEAQTSSQTIRDQSSKIQDLQGQLAAPRTVVVQAKDDSDEVAKLKAEIERLNKVIKAIHNPGSAAMANAVNSPGKDKK